MPCVPLLSLETLETIPIQGYFSMYESHIITAFTTQICRMLNLDWFWLHLS